jgi:hypothetical protein
MPTELRSKGGATCHRTDRPTRQQLSSEVLLVARHPACRAKGETTQLMIDPDNRERPAFGVRPTATWCVTCRRTSVNSNLSPSFNASSSVVRRRSTRSSPRRARPSALRGGRYRESAVSRACCAMNHSSRPDRSSDTCEDGPTYRREIGTPRTPAIAPPASAPRVRVRTAAR